MNTGRFRAILYGTPHRNGRRLWTFEVWDRATHRLAVTDHTCDWAKMLPMPLKGRRCPCPARHS